MTVSTNSLTSSQWLARLRETQIKPGEEQVRVASCGCLLLPGFLESNALCQEKILRLDRRLSVALLVFSL